MWWQLQHIAIIVLQAILLQPLKYSRGHCPFGRPICNQVWTSWQMSGDVASIYSHYVIVFPHLFCEVPQSLLQKSTPILWCCQGGIMNIIPTGKDGVSFPVGMIFFIFFIDILANLKKLNFFNQTRGPSFCGFCMVVWSIGFFRSDRPFRLNWYRTCLTTLWY